MKNEFMFFELIGGGHTEGYVNAGTFAEYKKGDIVKSTRDLEKVFGSKKFKRILKKDDLPKKKDIFIEPLAFIEEPVMSNDIEIDCIGEYRLSILICSLKNRKKKRIRLLEELERQHHKSVEILVEIDNEEISIGAKRNILLKKAKGDYIAFIDDDDMVSVNYVIKILEALKTNPDCCSLGGLLFRPGRRFLFYHSLKCTGWYEKGGVFYRTPNHLNTVKRELALQTGFLEVDHGEDADYSTRLKPLLNVEAYIKGVLYYYIKDKKWTKP